MPILWKYLSKEYLKVFFLSISAFVLILLIMRLKQIATFATLSADLFSLILFIFCQIPYILPISISCSCLISSIILFQRMSLMHELVALRSLGVSIKELLAPLLLIAIALSMLNFFIVSELTPRCRYKSKELFYKNTSVNPLVLLQRQKKMSNIKDSYIEISTKNKDLIAKNILIITPNKSNERLSMLTAKHLMLKENNLVGKNLSIISYINSHNENFFDNLFIENQTYMTAKADAITQFIKSKEWDMNISSMPIKMLLIHGKLHKNQKSQEDQKTYSKVEMEVTRRIAFALSAFSFTFIGASFGISINKITSKKNLITVLLFTLLVLFSFTLGKALKRFTFFSISAYLLPQFIVIFLTACKLKKISKGHK